MTAEPLDLGCGHTLRFADWNPDLDANPGLRPLAAQFPARVTAIITHERPGGGLCEGAITFDTPLAREYFTGPYWTVESWEPLTLSPSLACHCGDHGHIRGGRWVP